MKCTAGCGSYLEYLRGENKEDHSCYNPCCPSRTEAYYYPNIKVRHNWYFSPSYTLPFKHCGEWFALVGPTYGATVLYSIKPYIQAYNLPFGGFSSPISYFTCGQIEKCKIDYVALPVNQDFDREFQNLIDRFDNYLNKMIILDED